MSVQSITHFGAIGAINKARKAIAQFLEDIHDPLAQLERTGHGGALTDVVDQQIDALHKELDTIEEAAWQAKRAKT